MDHQINRRWVLRSGAALAGALLLPATQACEVQAEFLRITHPWTRATAPQAEFGVLCMRIDEVTADDMLIGLETPVASGVQLPGAPAGQPLALAIPAGSRIEMHEQGIHLQLTPLRLALEAGRSYPLQLTFARSGVVRTTLSVDFQRFS
jgi:copper(I)-binding protein